MEAEPLGGLILVLILIWGLYELNSTKARSKKSNSDRLKEIEKKCFKKIRPIITKHKVELGRQRRKLIRTDHYGKEFDQDWYEKELPYFYHHFIYPVLNKNEISNLHHFEFKIFQLIDTRAKSYKPKIPRFDRNMTGFEFEDFCADLLQGNDWQVEHTTAGADQGLDLIIRNEKEKIGVQCKKYSRPVGNKAVQEVKAGVEHYNLSRGVVISNNKYTRSAKELALSTNVKLLHYLDVDKI